MLANTDERDNVAIIYSWVYMIRHWWFYGRKWHSPSPIWKTLQDSKKIFRPQKKTGAGGVGGGGGVYVMENIRCKYRLPASCYDREPEVRNCWNYNWNLNGWVFDYELSGCWFASHCSHLNVRYVSFNLDVHVTTECRFTLKGICDMIKTHRQFMLHTWIIESVGEVKMIK